MALIDKLTAIGDAIREKTSGSENLTLDQMAMEIRNIKTGCGFSVAEKEVNFYDYDGTLIYAYSVSEAQALTELPAGPEHEGLIFQGWNWSLEGVKALTSPMNIGAQYITDDGTTRLYVHLENGRTDPAVVLYLNGTATVDWGDGTASDILTGSKYGKVYSPNHEYTEPGDYVIKIAVDGLAYLGYGSTYRPTNILCGKGSDTEYRNYVYNNAIKHVEIGAGIERFQVSTFARCYSLESIIIPESVKLIDGYQFEDCNRLSAIVLPRGIDYSRPSALLKNCVGLDTVSFPEGISTIPGEMFSGCRNIERLRIPQSVGSLGSSAFSGCYQLKDINIPDSITIINLSLYNACYALSTISIPDSVAEIKASAFSGCRSLSTLTLPKNVNTIAGTAFTECYGVKFFDFSKCMAVPTLEGDAFKNIPLDCEILVPAVLYDEWITATNWVTYASQIVAV